MAVYVTRLRRCGLSIRDIFSICNQFYEDFCEKDLAVFVSCVEEICG